MKKELKKLPIRCMYDHIITTANTRKVSASGIILTSKETGEILSRQTVLVAGPNAGVSVGEDVELYVEKFPRKNKGAKQVGSVSDIGPDIFEIIPPIEVIDKEPYLFISSREIKYVYIDLEKKEQEEKTNKEAFEQWVNTTTTTNYE